MADATEFQDWEVLSSGDDSVVVLGTVDDIRSDFFEKVSPSLSEGEKEGEQGGIDSDNPSSEDVDSESHPASEWREEDFNFNSDVEIKLIGEGDLSSRDQVGRNSSLSGIGGSHGVDETEHDEAREFSSGGNEKMEGEGEEGDGLGIRGSCREDEGKGVVWWKMPFQLVKLGIFKMKPIWLIPIAAAMMGFVILGRRLLRMRHKRLSSSLRIAVDDKKASDFMVQASCMNEASVIIRRVPVTRTFSTTGVVQWPVVLLR
ncbi:hypothetical protein Cni_G11109 [Canna indica]|uniref:Transmembrane protein n=1 Tax=Canna indica TaxID=4628 RepID=A0AAQ3K7F9_9LILI|nr:hypothetical protein Cni_G11109 [Canna indica]